MRFFTNTIFTLLATTTADAAAPLIFRKEPSPTQQSKSSCPATLPPKFITPALIVPISAKNPDTAYGTVYSPKITPDDFCTIFNLYIPPWAQDKTCTLEFLFPQRHQLESSTFSYSGGGHFTFAGFPTGVGATTKTTWNTRPKNGFPPPNAPSVMTPGHAYTINTGSCQAEQQGDLEVSGMICSNDTSFEYFQDYNPCPIGLYVTVS